MSAQFPAPAGTTQLSRLVDAIGPLPEGTPIYDSDGHLVATLGKSVQTDDDGFEFAVPLNLPRPEGPV